MTTISRLFKTPEVPFDVNECEKRHIYRYCAPLAYQYPVLTRLIEVIGQSPSTSTKMTLHCVSKSCLCRVSQSCVKSKPCAFLAVELRARQRTFDGAYTRGALANLGYSLTILRLFDKRFSDSEWRADTAPCRSADH